LCPFYSRIIHSLKSKQIFLLINSLFYFFWCHFVRFILTSTFASTLRSASHYVFSWRMNTLSLLRNRRTRTFVRFSWRPFFKIFTRTPTIFQENISPRTLSYFEQSPFRMPSNLVHILIYMAIILSRETAFVAHFNSTIASHKYHVITFLHFTCKQNLLIL